MKEKKEKKEERERESRDGGTERQTDRDRNQ